MKFDLTKKVVLEASWQKHYLIARMFLWATFLLATVFFGYRIFFPTQEYFLNFSNPEDKKNNLSAQDGQADKVIFNVYSPEKFSDARIQITTNKESAGAPGNIVMTRLAYQAFAYPLAEVPASFPEGSLEKSGVQYFIISNGKLREFQSLKVAELLGYTKEMFEEATEAELGYSQKGEIISNADFFPDGSLFFINESYYQMRNQKLSRFVSEKAYLSRYKSNQALEKKNDFLKKYLFNDEMIGFPDGSVLSFNIGVFVVVSDKVIPFNNPAIFLAFGYDWDDIIPVGEEEIGLYERDKFFSIKQPHPSGTVFFAEDSGKYYLINDGQKYEIKGAEILNKYLKKNPIIVQEQSLEFRNYCQLKPVLWPLHSCACSPSIGNLKGISGNNYQFEMQKDSEVLLTKTKIKFYRSLNWENMRDVLAEIKHKFLMNYGYEFPK